MVVVAAFPALLSNSKRNSLLSKWMVVVGFFSFIDCIVISCSLVARAQICEREKDLFFCNVPFLSQQRYVTDNHRTFVT